jgi:hypothetical protein
LAKDATNLDPGHVINTSSTSSIDPHCEGALSDVGNGTWSCERYYFVQLLSSSHLAFRVQINQAKQLVKESSLLCESPSLKIHDIVNHLTSALALKLAPQCVT